MKIGNKIYRNYSDTEKVILKPRQILTKINRKLLDIV
jgi:hypothetical protein